MAFAADKAGVFDSDAHRRVLAHLSTPDSDYGWTVEVLAASRMHGDYSLEHPELAPGEMIATVLKSAAEQGLCEANADGAYRLTQAGFEMLSIPPPDGGPSGPAQIESHPINAGSSTPWTANISTEVKDDA